MGAIRKTTVCSDSNWRHRRKMNICNSLRSSSSFEKWPEASLPVCSETFLIYHRSNLRWPSQIVDISIAASISNVVISDFSGFLIVPSLRNLNCKQWHIKARRVALGWRYTIQGDYAQGNLLLLLHSMLILLFRCYSYYIEIETGQLGVMGHHFTLVRWERNMAFLI